MVNRITVVEVCDARDDDSSTGAGPIVITLKTVRKDNAATPI
jgi:hypothetical protein